MISALVWCTCLLVLVLVVIILYAHVVFAVLLRLTMPAGVRLHDTGGLSCTYAIIIIICAIGSITNDNGLAFV